MRASAGERTWSQTRIVLACARPSSEAMKLRLCEEWCHQMLVVMAAVVMAMLMRMRGG